MYRDEACSNKIVIDSSGYVDLKAGIYYVKVTGTGTYQLSGNFSKAVSYDSEPNDTMQTAIPLTSGKLVKGNANILLMMWIGISLHFRQSPMSTLL